MKRFVRSLWGITAVTAVATVGTIALTEAGAGATQLILVGFLALAILWMKVQGLPEEPKERTGAGGSKGSR